MKYFEYYFHKQLTVGLLGFVLAAVFSLSAVGTVSIVVWKLPSISGFDQISWLSLFALLEAFIAALIAIFTLRTDTEENSDIND